TPLRKSLLERLPSLRLIVTTGMRNASIDVAAANQLGIVVCGTSGHSEPPAELTWALILALSRHIVDEVSSVRNNGLWQTSLGVDLYGKCLGLIGLGKIGNRVARVGAAFGMEVVAWSPHLTESRASEAGASLMESLEALLATSDIVSIHLVLGEGTYGLLGRHELNQMRSTALLINTSRAAIVDQQALIEALQMGTIAGAGLDVFDHEPLAKDDPIRSTPNLIATPHLGYVTERNYSTFFEQVIEDIAAFATGTPIRLLS
ncbi:MAG: D-2-hydroxyacid dehydrogenase family protein, partial [Ferrimicrobium acidiphilum]